MSISFQPPCNLVSKQLNLGMLKKNKFISTVECRCNAAQCCMIMQTSLPWLRLNTNQSLNPQNASHISPKQVSYGMDFVRIWEKIGSVITAPYSFMQNHTKQTVIDVLGMSRIRTTIAEIQNFLTLMCDKQMQNTLWTHCGLWCHMVDRINP